MARMIFSGVSEQAKASKHRLDDARALFGASRLRGAMYLAGYAVECRLKAKLMRIYGCRTLPELEDELRARKALRADATIFSHQLTTLLRLTQSLDRLRGNPEGWRQFMIVNRWLPAWRYAADLSDHDDAQDFLEAVEQVLRWIEANLAA